MSAHPPTEPAKNTGSSPFAQVYRIFASTLIGAPVVLTVVVVLSVTASTESLPVGVTAAIIAAVLLGGFAAQTFGYRLAPLTALGQEAVANQRFQQSATLRFALTEAPFIAVVALTYVLPYGWAPTLVAAVIAVPGLFFHLWPTRRVVGRSAERLESGGIPSGLRETFGHR
ncbi:MAG: hypothetical protein QM597_08930 [Aeromicrobium sp.]|uniref:hypothetical protein n=1 Tax=Aeromicrobium sp. TaxID=1871063 RepID=UPI0039E6C1AB